MNIPEFNEIIEPNDQTEARKANLEKIAALVGNVYPNKFVRSAITGAEDTITAIKSLDAVTSVSGERPSPEEKEALNTKLKALGTVRIAGRLTTPPRGNFVHLTDGISKLQIYCNKKGPLEFIRADGSTGDKGWELWQLVDHGDFIGVEGYLFVTNTGEVSVHVEKLQFLAKAMLPMPDKMHGIADPELRRRYRYADLIASSLQIEHDGLTTREVFERRAKLISGMRQYLDEHGYVEVETPMLTPKATGAAARPFETHHNALDIPLYARIAPELYLKRLLVGGFEKVYELNRNFRNEGLSQRHNPEFTMLEFYAAYMDVNGMMDFAEAMIQEAVKKANGGSLIVKYGENEIDFGKFESLSMKEAIIRWFPKGVLVSDRDSGDFESTWLNNDVYLKALKEFSVTYYGKQNYCLAIHPDPEKETEVIPIYESKAYENQGYFIQLSTNDDGLLNSMWDVYLRTYSNQQVQLVEKERANAIVQIFEYMIEAQLINPTFIIDYPKSISPLSKASPDDPQIAERFELFINGMEVANGFSELNDPREQYERFVDQMAQREGGDEEAMVLDEDYIRALSYGMPPAAGIGIGIDRLVMLLTNEHSIRDVILFPHMRPENRREEGDETAE